MMFKKLITEKTSIIQENYNSYTFLINPRYNKIEIKKILNNFFSIQIKEIKILTLKVKKKSVFKKREWISGYLPRLKKIIIKLHVDQKIDNTIK